MILLTYQIVDNNKAQITGYVYKVRRNGVYVSIADLEEEDRNSLKGHIIDSENDIPDTPSAEPGKIHILMLNLNNYELYYETHNRPYTEEEKMNQLRIEMGKIKQMSIHMFPAWQPNTDYLVYDVLVYNHTLYEVIQGHTSQEGWEPPNVPALFKLRDPDGVTNDWVQPTGAHDAYREGDNVIHNDRVWISIVHNNVWEPGIYGWVIQW